MRLGERTTRHVKNGQIRLVCPDNYDLAPQSDGPSAGRSWTSRSGRAALAGAVVCVDGLAGCLTLVSRAFDPSTRRPTATSSCPRRAGVVGLHSLEGCAGRSGWVIVGCAAAGRAGLC